MLPAMQASQVAGAVPPRISRYQTDAGRRIYTVEVDAFPALTVQILLTVQGAPQRPEYTALIDFGSERRACFTQLENGLAAIREQFGENISLAALDRLILTHAHTDHLGGLPRVREAAPQAPLAAHQAAKEALEHPAEAQQQSSAVLRQVMAWQGVPESEAAAWLKQVSRPILPAPFPAQLYVEHGDVIDGIFKVVHVPGHAADQMALRVDDIIMTADHLLPGSLPPLWPTRLREGVGIRPYLISLARVNGQSGLSKAVSSHGPAVDRPAERIEEIRARLTEKSQRLYHLIEKQPGLSIFELTAELYNAPQRQRLYVNQVAALAEYMEGRGLLVGEVGSGGAAHWRINPAVEPTVK